MPVPERQVYLSMARPESGPGNDPPDVAVIELRLDDLLGLLGGSSGAFGGPASDTVEVATIDVAWTSLPAEYRGLAYEALVIVRDCAYQWERAVWMDHQVLEGLGALPTRRSRCLFRGTDYVWEVDHADHVRLRTDPVSLVDVLRGLLYVGDPFRVRATCELMAKLCPEVLANALLAGVGPRFGVADRDITRRSIVEMVGPDELRPMLFDESERVRRAAREALEEEAPPPT